MTDHAPAQHHHVGGEHSPVTALLERAVRGDNAAADGLYRLIEHELRALAAGALSRERRDHTLQPTALVDDAFVKLIGQQRATWRDRQHFFAMAAEVMRRMLVDHARGHNAVKRGSGARTLTLDDQHAIDPADPAILDLDHALTRFEAIDQAKAVIVKHKCFGGRSMPEIASMLDRPLRSVEEDWRKARMWLAVELGHAYA